MLLWFLRLFPLFAVNEADLLVCRQAIEDMTADNLRLQDRLDSALAEKEHLWTAMQEAMDNERHAMRMQINHAIQKAGGGIPYPDSHSLPVASILPLQESGPIGRSGRILPSEAVARRNASFSRQFTQRVSKGSE
jgi:hypothetical protein